MHDAWGDVQTTFNQAVSVIVEGTVIGTTGTLTSGIAPVPGLTIAGPGTWYLRAKTIGAVDARSGPIVIAP